MGMGIGNGDWDGNGEYFITKKRRVNYIVFIFIGVIDASLLIVSLTYCLIDSHIAGVPFHCTPDYISHAPTGLVVL